MIRWLIKTVVDHPDLSALRPPAGLLTAAENALYATYQSPQRRRDWLLGRWTAKHLIQQHIAATYGFSPPLDAFSVIYDEAGALLVTSDHPALTEPSNHASLPIALTLSHSHGYACSAITRKTANDVRIGVDIELIEPRPATFAEAFFTPTEQATVNAAPPALHDLLATALWSVKEATLKATRDGLTIDPRFVECRIRPTRPRHWTPIRVSIAPHIYAPLAITSPLRVWWRVIDNQLRPGTAFVLTIAAFGVAL